MRIWYMIETMPKLQSTKNLPVMAICAIKEIIISKWKDNILDYILSKKKKKTWKDIAFWKPYKIRHPFAPQNLQEYRKNNTQRKTNALPDELLHMLPYNMKVSYLP